mmetsp:Transcript_18243/g.28190  ORF Transcript_18243/g.28190 Transcript_18243/m.28190 type:complete len:358 (+) Transcript_18243:42-1115(+)
MSTITLNPAMSTTSSSGNISPSEMNYIVEGCRDNMRLDGRTCQDYRHYTLSTQSSSSSTTTTSNGGGNDDGNDTTIGPLVLSNGSARILLPGGGTHVLCSVKADLVHPAPGITPSEGVLELHVDHAISPSSSSRHQRRQADMELQSLLRKLFLPHAVDRQALCIVPHQYVWRLNIDVLIFACQGNLVDICAMVMRAALQQTKLPHITPISATTNKTDGSSVTKKSSSSSATSDLAVDGDIIHARRPPGIENCPVIVTTNILKCRPTVMLLDATKEEEACASCQVSVAVDPQQRVCGIQKHSSAGTIAFGMIHNVTTTAVQASKHVLDFLSNHTNKDHSSPEVEQQPQDFLQDHFHIR